MINIKLIAKYIVSGIVILVGGQTIVGTMAIRIMLQGEKESLIFSDFSLYLLLGVMYFIIGSFSAITYEKKLSNFLRKTYIFMFSITVLTTLIYFFKDIDYLHAPIQLEVYSMFIKPTFHRYIELSLYLVVLGIVSLPPLMKFSSMKAE
jgi:hypothetical protein